MASVQGYWSRPSAPDIVHAKVQPLATYAPWLANAEFRSILAVVEEHTLVDEMRLWELFTLSRQVCSKVAGDVLEVGVWRGGSGAILAHALKGMDCHVYLADTFSGVIKAGEFDTAYEGGEHADATVEDVQQLLGRIRALNASVLVGPFPDETGPSIDGPLSFVHVDVDVYASARDIMTYVAPRMAIGGAVVFDDFGFYGCEGVTRFVLELTLDPQWIVVHNLNGHAVCIRAA